MPEDALPFPFCLSGFTDETHGSEYKDDLSVAHGNIVLADHGLTIANESLGAVPEPQILLAPDAGADRCHRPSPQHARPRFRPSLQAQPLTQATLYDAALPASASLVVGGEKALCRPFPCRAPRDSLMASAARLVRQRAGCGRVRRWGSKMTAWPRFASVTTNMGNSRNPAPLSPRPIASAMEARATSGREHRAYREQRPGYHCGAQPIARRRGR